MPSDRPTIGVTGPDRGGAAAWWFTRLAVWLACGRAVRITPGYPHDIDGLDGLIVGGGADVDPKLYGQELLHVAAARKPDEPPRLYLLGLVLFPLTWLARKFAAVPAPFGRDAARDELEMRLIDQAVQRRLPILGICRGGQLLNVYFGGTLHQNLKSFYVEDPEVRSILPRKKISVQPGGALASALSENPGRVNALHRQAIDHLGRELRVAARDRNGIVQAIEHASLPFAVGVQWHPEYLPQIPQQRALFHKLVICARRHVAPAQAPQGAPSRLAV